MPSPARPRGRPPKAIDLDLLVDAVERLLEDGGVDAVTVETAAREMGVSKATMYRIVPGKPDLLALLFGRMTEKLASAAQAATALDGRDARDRLHALMTTHISSAIEMRHYLFVFFDGRVLPDAAYETWRLWRRAYEAMWLETVTQAAEEGVIRTDDPVMATRLILGSCIWVSRWYRPEAQMTAVQIADVAIGLIDRTP